MEYVMKYNFDEAVERRGTGCLKYDFAKERGKKEDVLPLWVADMDFKTAPAVTERLQKVVEHGIYGYSDSKEDYFAAVKRLSDMAKEGQTAVDWLKGQGLSEYKIIHLQGVMGSAAQQGRSGALDEAVASDGWTLVTQQTAEWNAEKAQQIVQSVIDSGESFNVIYAENDDMAKGAVAALDKANISHGVGKDVIVMGFDCNKWALEELLNQNWNYDGQCNPFQASYIDDIIKTLESGGTISEKTIIMEEKGFDAASITQEDVDKYGI